MAGGAGRNRTGVHGFAVRCVTTPPRHLKVVSYIRDFWGWQRATTHTKK